MSTVVNNYNIQTEPHFLNRTKQNSCWTESEFFFLKKTEPKPNQNKKIYSAHPYLVSVPTESGVPKCQGKFTKKFPIL